MYINSLVFQITFISTGGDMLCCMIVTYLDVYLSFFSCHSIDKPDIKAITMLRDRPINKQLKYS